MATRTKAPARAAVPQTQAECDSAIAQLGELQRQLARQVADMNDHIEATKANYKPGMEELQAKIKARQDSIQTWAESNRVALLGEGDKRGKTARLLHGELGWRIKPPSVRISAVDAVIDTLQRMGLGRFVRTKLEVNKDAILTEPEAVRGIAGVTLVSGVEDFFISPFEQNVEA